MISEEQQDALTALGRRLRAARLARNEPQALLAARIGISVPTLRAMEQGAPTVQIGCWVQALWVLDRLGELEGLLAARLDLFAQAQAEARQRARRRP
jgi:transcriptional regulator with XRE-family HTH domain